jgi:hypothetical protein
MTARAGLIVALWALRASAAEAPPEAVPQALAAPPDQVLRISARGVGVQIYECAADKENPARYSWTLKAPEAELRDFAGKKLGKHYGGPTWEATDGSTVVGEVVAREPGPDIAAIPWLLLRAKSNSGDGAFSAIQSVQRLHTAGGKAPDSGCDQTRSGKETRVPYTADYYFYTAARR